MNQIKGLKIHLTENRTLN